MHSAATMPNAISDSYYGTVVKSFLLAILSKPSSSLSGSVGGLGDEEGSEPEPLSF